MSVQARDVWSGVNYESEYILSALRMFQKLSTGALARSEVVLQLCTDDSERFMEVIVV